MVAQTMDGRGMRELFIFRHGETEWNVQQRMQGRLDSPLTEAGRRQAGEHGELVRSLGGLQRLWVSPAGRTTETAHIINTYAQATLDFVEALQERDCGAWGGLTVQQIEAQFPREWSARQNNLYHHAPPGGENLHDMRLRVQAHLDSLFALAWQRAGLVTHGVMSKVILKYFLGLSEVECTRLRHPNELCYRLTVHPERIDIHHLLSGGQAQKGLLYSENR